MTPNALPSEVVAVVGSIDPDANTAATYDSDYCDMADFECAMGIGQTGTMGSAADITFSLVQATSSAGAGVKAITGKSATVLEASPGDSDKQVVLNVRGDELDVAGGFRYVALRMVVATATSDCSGVLLGCFPIHAPASDFDVASVAEVVN